MTQVIEALIGQRIRIKLDEGSSFVSFNRLRGLGFSESELTTTAKCKRIFDKIYRISAAKVGASVGQPTLMIRIQDWPLDFHNADEFEWIEPLIPEPRTEHDHPLVDLGKKKLAKPYPNIEVVPE